ncbi:MAG: DEAD/DEAH box helicase family protein [Minisyncoccia bacterium]
MNQYQTKTLESEESIELYDHQIPVLEKLMEFIENNANIPNTSGFVVLPGGSGKTIIFSSFVKKLNVRSIIVSPTLTILEQNFKTMQKMSPETKLSVYGGEEKNLSGDIVFTTYKSLVSLIKKERIKHDFCKVVIFDEGHRSLSEDRSTVLKKLNAICIAFTATDKFSEQKNVEKVFINEIYRMSLKEAIESSTLLPLRGFIVETKINLKKVKLQNRNQLNEALAEKYLNILARNKIARDYYLEKFNGVPSVFFCISVNHSIKMAEYLKSSGVKAEVIHSKIRGEERRKIINDFNSGKLDALCSCDILTEGWDSEHVVVEFNLRPTYSWVLAEQRACRVIRPSEGKKVGIIIEFQDICNKRDQPIFVHHLFGIRYYQQGGYVCAPNKNIKSEKERLDLDLPIDVLDGLTVNKNIKEVASLGYNFNYDISLENKYLVKEILLSRNDVDYRTLSKSAFLNLEFSHITYHGNGRGLLKKFWGILWQERKEDYEMFIQEYLGEYLFNELPENEHVYLNKIDNFDIEDAVDEDVMIDKNLIIESLKIDINRCLNFFSDREKLIIQLFFGLDGNKAHDLDEIAEKVNLTKERVRQVKGIVLIKLLRRGHFQKILTKYTEYIVYGTSGMLDTEWKEYQFKLKKELDLDTSI